MTFEIAEIIIPYFSQDEDAGGAVGTLSIWRRGPWTTVNGRRVPGQKVPVPNIRGNVAPLLDADVDTTEGTGRKREGHMQVYTLDPLQVTDEASQETSWLLLHEGYWYTLEEQDNWHYARGYVYRATRERRESNV